jgi:hypothetical protein
VRVIPEHSWWVILQGDLAGCFAGIWARCQAAFEVHQMIDTIEFMI